MKNTKKILLGLVLSVALISGVVYAELVSYNRTPSGDVFSDTTVNIEGDYNHHSNLKSYKIFIDNVESECFTQPVPSDEIIFDADFELTPKSYYSVGVKMYEDTTNCSGEVIEVLLEPLFTIEA